MKYTCTVIAVADMNAARKFYEDLFGLEVFQDYGRNIAFTCGLALQQDFDWLVNLPKEKVLKNPTMRKLFLRNRTLTDFCAG
jgi:catechol 2,3-dioxygenase-like lactoylglutathione lyase family enzyme